MTRRNSGSRNGALKLQAHHDPNPRRNPEVVSVRIRRDAGAGRLRVAADPRPAGMAGLMLIAVCTVMEDQVAGRSAAQRAAGSCEGGQQSPW